MAALEYSTYVAHAKAFAFAKCNLLFYTFAAHERIASFTGIYVQETWLPWGNLVNFPVEYIVGNTTIVNKDTFIRPDRGS